MLRKISYSYYHHKNKYYNFTVTLLTFTTISDVSPLKEYIPKALLWFQQPCEKKKELLLELTNFQFEASADTKLTSLKLEKFFY